EGSAIVLAPSCTALVTAADIPRALKLAVGLNDSSLTNRLANPEKGPRDVHRSSGGAPSPSEIACSGAWTGSTSQELHIERSDRLRMTSGVNRPHSDSRSYPATSGLPHAVQRFCSRSIG